MLNMAISTTEEFFGGVLVALVALVALVDMIFFFDNVILEISLLVWILQ